MVVVGLIAGATSMVQVVKVWADKVLKKMAGWKEIPVDTTIGRIVKMATPEDIVALTGMVGTSILGAGVETCGAFG